MGGAPSFFLFFLARFSFSATLLSSFHSLHSLRACIHIDLVNRLHSCSFAARHCFAQLLAPRALFNHSEKKRDASPVITSSLSLCCRSLLSALWYKMTSSSLLWWRVRWAVLPLESLESRRETKTLSALHFFTFFRSPSLRRRRLSMYGLTVCRSSALLSQALPFRKKERRLPVWFRTVLLVCGDRFNFFLSLCSFSASSSLCLQIRPYTFWREFQTRKAAADSATARLSAGRSSPPPLFLSLSLSSTHAHTHMDVSQPHHLCPLSWPAAAPLSRAVPLA